MRIKLPVLVGIFAGLLFFAHAMINNSHAWPLIWPALAGVVAVWWAHRRQPSGYGADLALAGAAGLSAGVVYLVTTALALSGLGLLENASMIGLFIAAGLGLAAALALGALTHPIAVRRA